MYKVPEVSTPTPIATAEVLVAGPLSAYEVAPPATVVIIPVEYDILRTLPSQIYKLPVVNN